MRDSIAADWAFSIQSTIENVVREHFPAQLRQWPLLQSFNFEAYQVGSDHFVIVLRDKLSGIPAGPGEPSSFPYTDHPPIHRTEEDVQHWLAYLIDRFALRHEDMAMVLPIHDSGQHNAIVDYQLFSDLEKDLWHYQIAFWISEHHPNLQTLIEVAPEEPPQDDAAPGESTQVEAAPEQPSHAVYYVSGTNVRVNINSVDSSVNVVEQSPVEVFQQLLTAVQSTTIDPELIATMTAAIEDMQRNYGTEYFAEDYRAFMAILADHIQVFGAVVAPYLPALAQLLPSN